mmetsp:Transcript_2323/g.8261  ORF Transcript_2323/g.8261 Transcript_2323/m.8261 type:complete len:250 (-) Transcript_2323:145-894(-)
MVFMLVRLSATTEPVEATNMSLQRLNTASGAPFTKKKCSPESLSRTRVLIDLRSRENSRVASFSYWPSSWRLQYSVRSASLTPLSTVASATFSTSTRSATSVGSPMLSYLPVSCLKLTRASLHRLQTLDSSSRDWFDAASISSPVSASVSTPVGLYVVPDTANSSKEALPRLWSPTTATWQTDIWLVVRVPVLSEQMTVVQPRVSTEGSERTIALFFAIFMVPRARHVVTTAGRPSGIAATARATAILK